MTILLLLYPEYHYYSLSNFQISCRKPPKARVGTEISLPLILYLRAVDNVWLWLFVIRFFPGGKSICVKHSLMVSSSYVFFAPVATVLTKCSIFWKTVHDVGNSEQLLYNLKLFLIAVTCRLVMSKSMVGIIKSQSYFLMSSEKTFSFEFTCYVVKHIF